MSSGEGESPYEEEEKQGYAGTEHDPVPESEHTAEGQFTPHLVTVKPATGAAGDVITLVGDDLSAVSEVHVGDEEAGFEIVNDHELTVTVPDGSGTVAVTVITPDGQTDLHDAFTYTGNDG